MDRIFLYLGSEIVRKENLSCLATLIVVYNLYRMTEIVWEEESHDIIYSSDVAISRACSKEAQTLKPSDDRLRRIHRMPCARQPLDRLVIFYSAKHIFTAEHVLAFRKRSTCMRIPESLYQESLQKESLQHHEWTKICDRSSFFQEIGFVIFHLRKREKGREMWKTCCLNIRLSQKCNFSCTYEICIKEIETFLRYNLYFI